MAPSWVTRGLHSENGGRRGLTAKDAVCIEFIIAVEDLIYQNFVKENEIFLAVPLRTRACAHSQAGSRKECVRVVSLRHS